MDDNNSENSHKIPTNLVSNEERSLRMFFTSIRLSTDKNLPNSYLWLQGAQIITNFANEDTVGCESLQISSITILKF